MFCQFISLYISPPLQVRGSLFSTWNTPTALCTCHPRLRQRGLRRLPFFVRSG